MYNSIRVAERKKKNAHSNLLFKYRFYLDRNPITGEGYHREINTTVPSLNGAKQVINKNRIPPGGFSSGLW